MLKKPASGIEVDEQTQLEQALENIMEKMDEYELKWTKESEEVNTKAEKEKAAAEDVRKRAMESLSENKRSDADRDDVTSSKPIKARNTGTETVAFLREKTLRDNEFKKAELELRRQEQEKKHQAQVRQQEEQRILFDTMQQQMQQQHQQAQQQQQQLTQQLLQCWLYS